MVDYKLKVMCVEYDTLNFFPIRHNYNAYLRVYNNCGDGIGTVLPDYTFFRGSGIPEKAVFGSQKTLQLQIQFYPLSTLVVKNTVYTQSKYMLPQILTYTKISERIYPNTNLEIYNDKVITLLLINFKYMVIMVESGFPLFKYAVLRYLFLI